MWPLVLTEWSCFCLVNLFTIDVVPCPFGFSIRDSTLRDLNLTMTASGEEVPWLILPLLNSWTQRGLALSTNCPVHTDSSQIAVHSAMALLWITPGWWRTGTSTAKPAREGGARQAGTSWERHLLGEIPGGALGQLYHLPRPLQRAEKPTRTACHTSPLSTESTVRARRSPDSQQEAVKRTLSSFSLSVFILVALTYLWQTRTKCISHFKNRKEYILSFSDL